MMINLDLLLLIVFYILLLIIFKVYRNKFQVQWKIFALYKTKLGLKLMDKISKKYSSLLYVLGYLGIFVGYLGMIITFGFILWATYSLLFIPASEAALAPVLPGIQISEHLPVLSFWHWIIAILIVAVVHEFSHGVYARLKNVRIKSSGWAFLGPILAAFVEPDEKQLNKKRARDQLLVLSAGPFSNILLGIFIFLLMALVFVPISSSMVNVNGIVIADIDPNLPINASGLGPGYVLEEIEGKKIDDANIIMAVLENKKPGDTVKVTANGKNYEIVLSEHSDDPERALLGISFSSFDTSLKNPSLSWVYKILRWFNMLLFWTFNISIGVGLFNLLPIGPVDGGRMFYVTMLKLTKKKEKALKLLGFVSTLVLFLIIINLIGWFVGILF